MIPKPTRLLLFTDRNIRMLVNVFPVVYPFAPNLDIVIEMLVVIYYTIHYNPQNITLKTTSKSLGGFHSVSWYVSK